MKDYLLHHETLRSNRTLALFVELSLLFLALSLWRVSARGLDGIAILLLVFLAMFLFYTHQLPDADHPHHALLPATQIWGLHLARADGEHPEHHAG